MQAGESVRLVCTGDYAYGAAGFPAWGIGPNATLTFEVHASIAIHCTHAIAHVSMMFLDSID